MMYLIGSIQNNLLKSCYFDFWTSLHICVLGEEAFVRYVLTSNEDLYLIWGWAVFHHFSFSDILAFGIF